MQPASVVEWVRMLALTMTQAGPGVVLQHVSPMVYLDHWALRKFSEDNGLASRLTGILRGRGGTLALSWLNLGEYATVSDSKQRRAAEQFVEGILPSVFCIDVDLAAVDKRERARHPLPHADPALALLFLNRGGQGLNAFTATGLFELYDERLARTKDRLAAEVQKRLKILRQTHGEDDSFRKAVNHSNHPEAIQATTPTRAVVREMAATFFPDLKRAITPNDAIDFLHAANPVRYCDIVLLDGGTADLVERARRKLSGTCIKMATVFSPRKNGVERFLALLEKA